MAQLLLECPHCRAEKIGFAPRYAGDFRPGVAQTILFLQCLGCGEGLAAVVDNFSRNVQHWCNGQANDLGKILRTYPAAAAHKAPADVPPEVQTAYLSGLDNLGRPNGTNTAAIMFRRAIEVAVKKLDPGAPKGANLRARIDRLADDIATPAMKDWAHHVRLEANDAAHEPEEFTKDEAKELGTFAELFLTYAYTLPKMLERAKPPAAAAAPAKP